MILHLRNHLSVQLFLGGKSLSEIHGDCMRSYRHSPVGAGRGGRKAPSGTTASAAVAAGSPSPPHPASALPAPHRSASTSLARALRLLPPASAVSTSINTSVATASNSNSSSKHSSHQSNHNHASATNRNGNGNGNHHSASNGSNGTAKSDGSGPSASNDLYDIVAAASAPTVRVHLVVPRCTTVPGEYLTVVGDCEALGSWDVERGVRLHWCSGHMHTATITLPADWQSLKAKLVMVHGQGQHAPLTWEPGQDRNIVLQPPPAQQQQSPSSSSNANGSSGGLKGSGGKAGGSTAAAAAATTGSVPPHEYVVICHWGHTDGTSVLAREVPGEVLVLEQRLAGALSELRTARNAAATSQEKLQRMAQDLASSERVARQSAEQLAELQSKHSAMATELTETKRQAKAAAAEAATAAAAAAKASSVNVAEVEARVSKRYEARMAELKLQLDDVKGVYSAEVTSLQQKLEASLSKEAEAQEMVQTLREIVQKDVARLRTELSQLVNEYIAARQQLQEQAQQIEASEKLRMQQIDGLSSEIKNLISKYNTAQQTITEQQRLLDELQAGRGGPLPPHTRGMDAVQHVAVPPPPDNQAGRGWRADWARLSKLTTTTANSAATASSGGGSTGAAGVAAGAANTR
ncbi:hypothetical protein VOLCADRAFT_92161 [Volvox carteri f. nagariensis]|uniref:CBM20 domain-containing protein n=1 Tax=Volvox carteri f. nagariensis TaxID=3068 RepID=D8TYS3_VOLCA|nr:uncharacterized protein VOLCADRAFT_92161 [Volvox carteri f. nagariensis]EFJ47443.1 hypothetical protein VOLCADRAFT_92161 [Volvox carteri f. nagariensis]|eukprot:XP_002951632.1 hypothetical protein VOLCADRAFT_92161 [Volvox carteri f. nagariensis]